MKSILKIIFIVSLFFSGIFFSRAFVFAQEKINSFDSQIKINSDASIIVNETIKYDFGNTERHGIYRNIPIKYKSTLGDKSIKLEIQNVTRDGNSENYVVSFSDSDEIIKIGNANLTINGEHIYSIVYKATGAIGYFDNYDELYWNITGNSWQVPILNSNTKIELPQNSKIIQSSCYLGVLGSKEKCDTSIKENIASASSSRTLNSGEGLTFAAGFPKGTVAIYQVNNENIFFFNVKTLWPILIPIAVFIIMFYLWYKKGRDPKGTGVIIPEYNVLDGLTPLEVGGIINEKVKNQNISAEIIYLATKGYLKIIQTEEKLLGIFSEKDYKFTLLKEIGDLQSHDQELLKAMFKDNIKTGSTINLSGLKNTFFVSIPIIEDAVNKSLLDKKYYTNLPKIIPIGKGIMSIVIPCLWILLIFFGTFFKSFSKNMGNFLVIILSIITAYIVWVIFQRIMPAKTPKGVSAREYLLGLKEYLEVAEKDRLNFHNMPEKKPEIFEALLPYAMIFGVEELWAKEFENIYIVPPNWYSGRAGNFSVVYFGREMASFGSFTTGTLASTPSRGGSGSGGGGFSGGGGGGGGGGSW